VFDKHALTFGHGLEELVEVLLIVLAQRTQLALGTILQGDFLGELLEFDFV
jgi:hypothetical protein